MAARSGMIKMVVCLAVVWMVILSGAEAAMTCGGVVQTLKPCMVFLKSSGGAPPGVCCKGVRTLKSMAQSTADRRTACQCMKAAASKIQGFNYGIASKLAGQCNVPISYIFSPKLDCNIVQ